ncbi:MAG: carboxypeptidase-like regulatory domain-containing protein [Haliscomenobacter sp.]|nr:carboxypeptidase-like regulatory domain-containing protein [Haliscomenobacter sp.]
MTGQRVWVSGRVTDARTGEPVLFANVYLPESPSTGTMTDVEGVFEFGFDRSKGPGWRFRRSGIMLFHRKCLQGIAFGCSSGWSLLPST